MRDAFLDGGGDAKLVMFDPLGQDGHALFSLAKGRLKWLQEMDALLRFRKLPTWQRQDVSALMHKLNAQEQHRGFIERFVAAPVEKALAQSSGGKMTSGYGSKARGDVRTRALNLCQKQNPLEKCTLVMENDDWVGAKTTPGPMPTPQPEPNRPDAPPARSKELSAIQDHTTSHARSDFFFARKQ